MRISWQKHVVRKAVDHRLEALATGLRRAVAGETETERLAGAEAVLGALRPLLEQRMTIAGKRGPKRRFDTEWAEAQLLDLAIADPDGLPERQGVMAARLLARFVATKKPQPSIAWAMKIVGAFYRKATLHDQESRQKYRDDPSLQILFQNEDRFVICCRMRYRVDEKWAKDKTLHERFSTPADYLNSILWR